MKPYNYAYIYTMVNEQITVNQESTRVCASCNEPLEGRSDKRFCSTYCKSNFQYRMRHTKDTPVYILIANQLKLNRRILKKYNAGGFSTLKAKLMLDDGFNPDYFTHYFKAQNGNLYFFCYEFGYRYLPEEEKYMLIKWQPYMKPGKTILNKG